MVLDYLTGSVAQARYWAEVCLDPEDDCPAFRDHVRAILRDALRVLNSTNIFPPQTSLQIRRAISDVISATYSETMHLANERLQHLTELLQALDAEISTMEVSVNASEAKASTTTSQ